MTISSELFAAIEGWMQRSNTKDIPSMRIGRQALTPRQIVEELRASTETGLKLEEMLKGMISTHGQAFVIESFKK